MNINSISDYRKAVRIGPYAWPGGYPLFFLMADGECCCFNCIAKKERRSVLDALAYPEYGDKQWTPVALEINWEDEMAYCANCNKDIECAYPVEPALPLNGPEMGP